MRLTFKYPPFRHVVLLLTAVSVLTFVYVVSGRYTFQRISDVSEQSQFTIGLSGTSGDSQATTTPAEWTRRAEQVKAAFVHAYSGYERYAFPHDELLPLSNGSKDNFNAWGVSVFDSLDTMLLMGLTNEFERALTLVENTTFPVQQKYTVGLSVDLSFFETVIRYMGGLLSAYAFSHEPILLQKADELAQVLEPVFVSRTGYPHLGFQIISGKVRNTSIAGMLAEIASCQVEYAYLARLTGKKEHYDRAARIFENLRNVNLTLTGALPMRLSLINGHPADYTVSVGGGADSAHEYLLKYYLLTGQKDASILAMYMKSIDHILSTNLYLTPHRSLLYVTDTFGPARAPTHRFDHLSCFFPGLLALGVSSLPASAFPSPSARDMHMWAAVGLGETCWRMYADAPTGLGPEVVEITLTPVKVPSMHIKATNEKWVDAMDRWKVAGMKGAPPGTEEKGAVKEGLARDYDVIRTEHFLRPETIESMYMLWKVTGDIRWRERGWTIFKAIERETRTAVGYATVQSVEVSGGQLDDDMPSFFLAETLKYLYLLFSNDDPVPLDKWVFNTEAHPLPIFDWSSWEKHKFGILDS